jgi:prepilin-type N-terminal cleavage/methylation domain-containing protein
MTYRARPGFSLIEVLIAIVVLALGLLGLASVFPVVVAQQRGVTDSVNGVSLERSAIEALENDSRLAQRSFDTGIPNGQIDPDERRGWDLLIAEPTWSRNGAWVLAEDTSGSGVIEYTPDGRIELRENNTGLSVVIPVSQRLSPVGEQLAPGTEPRYVWDFVTRRIDAGAPNVVSQSTACRRWSSSAGSIRASAAPASRCPGAWGRSCPRRSGRGCSCPWP